MTHLIRLIGPLFCLVLYTPTIFGSEPHNFTKSDMAGSFVEACSEIEDNSEISACLNEQIELQLMGYFQERFEVEILDYAQNKRIEDFELSDTVPLYEQFQIEIPSHQPNAYALECFDYYKTWMRKKTQIRQVANLLLDAALFVKQYHVYSLGKNSSLLFQPHKVQVCGASDSFPIGVHFKDGVLKLGMNFSTYYSRIAGAESFDYEFIQEQWRYGDIFAEPNKRDIGFTDKLKGLLSKSLSPDNINDALKAKWPLLNPIGKVRRSLRASIYSRLKPRIERLLDKLRSNQFGSLISEPMAPSQLSFLTSDENKEDISQRFKQKLTSPQLIGQAVGYTLAKSQQNKCKDAESSVVADRVQEDGQILQLMNTKNIDIDVSLFTLQNPNLEKFFGDSNSDEAQDCSTTTEVKSRQSGAWVQIDLIDNISVNASFSNNFIQRFSQMALYEAVLEAMEESSLSRN